jgi:hypothetical protein
MGAGTFYTHNFDGSKAAWINYPDGADSYEIAQINEDLVNVLKKLGYKPKSNNNHEDCFRNGLFTVKLEGKYHGDGVVINFQKDSPYPALAQRNFIGAENKILKAIQKAGYQLHIATSGYTSEKLTV